MIGTRLRGAIAGAIGTAAMSGTAITVRRLVDPAGQLGKTHYEGVVQEIIDRLPGDRDPAEVLLSPESRRRLGEAAHFGFGALSGACLGSFLERQGRLPTAGSGFLWGNLLWVAAFMGYLPALGVTRRLPYLGNSELARTWLAHVTYGVTTALIARALSDRNKGAHLVS